MISRCFNNTHSNETHAIRPFISRPAAITAVVLGAIVALGGIFFLLASVQVLPYGANAISQLGVAGIAIDSITIVICLIIAGWGAKQLYNQSQEPVTYDPLCPSDKNNENTQIDFSKDKDVDGKKLAQDSKTIIPQKEKKNSEPCTLNTSPPLIPPRTHATIDDKAFEQFCAYRKGSNKDKAFAHAIGASFFYYNCDEIKDYGWGCAWRCIQICVSALNLIPSFKELFEKYRLTKSTNEWAEPGYGKRYLDDQGIPSQLILYNKEQGTGKTPTAWCQKINGFSALRDKLIDHFNKYATPVMADDVSYAMTIVGIRLTSDDETILFIADPHKISHEGGLYYVVLDKDGKQIATTGIDDGKNGLSTVRCAHFNKGWMLLFPQPKTN